MTARRPFAVVAAVLTGMAVLAGAASAQGPLPLPGVEWEPVGLDSFRVTGVLFAPGPAPDGSLDTLYTADVVRSDVSHADGEYDGPHRLPPGGEWTGDLCVAANGAGCIPDTIGRSARGTLLVGAYAGISGIMRSTDAGRTWTRDRFIDHVHCLYGATAAFGHDVFACDTDGFVWRSPDGAEGTWEAGGLLDPDEPYLHAFSLTEALTGPALAGPRLVAAARGGIAYSDDGARTWVRSSLWQNYAYWVDGGIVGHAVAGHPFGGVLYAGVRDFWLGYPTIYVSEDGGATWALRARGPDMSEFRFSRGTVAVDRAGGVWVGTYRRSGPTFTVGTVLWSGDGGRTWADVGAGLPGVSVSALEIGRDGRLYLGTDAGVWRSAEPVHAVAAGPDRAASDLAVSVAPNPSSGLVTARLSLGAPSAVRVAVVDAVGREVAVVWDGPARDGQRVALDTETWAPGVYVVRAVGADGAAARVPFTLVR